MNFCGHIRSARSQSVLKITAGILGLAQLIGGAVLANDVYKWGMLINFYVADFAFKLHYFA